MGDTGGVVIDLHTHSTESDGTDTPTQLVGAAAAAGLDVIALTDHDTTAGWAEAERAVRDQRGPRHVRVVPGAELSCQCPDGQGRHITVHMLAYLFDPRSETLVAEQARLRAERRTRLRVMASRMADDGFPVDPDALMEALPEDSPGGRPHLARMLVQAGAAEDVNDAFARYLGNHGRYYLPRSDTPVFRAVSMIAEAGGVTVLAHPFATARGRTVSARTIAELAAAGLGGVEIDHPDHDADAREQLREIATTLDLVPTGSSDYHGTNKTIALGAETTDSESLGRLAQRATGSKIFE